MREALGGGRRGRIEEDVTYSRAYFPPTPTLTPLRAGGVTTDVPSERGGRDGGRKSRLPLPLLPPPHTRTLGTDEEGQ